MRAKRVLFAVNFMLIAILACNMPGGQAAGVAGTLTAQALISPSPATTPTAIVPVTGASETPAGVQVSVTSVTNCRTGPSTAYDLIFTANPGESFQVVGKNTPTGYWIITNPAGGTCWLWGQYAVLTGDTASLPEYPVPPAPPKPTKPTKTPKPTATATATSTQTSGSGGIPTFVILTFVLPLAPAVPANFAQNRSCGSTFVGVTPTWVEDIYLTWSDTSGETGYHIYRNGNAVDTLAADATAYHIQISYNQGTGGALYDTFAIDAFNSFRKSAKAALDVPRCP